MRPAEAKQIQFPSNPGDTSKKSQIPEYVANPMAKAAPEFEGIAGWINSEPLSLQDLRGKVVFLDFWTYGCINCQRTLPSMRIFHERYSADGLVVVGVHTPELPYERKRENVQRAVALAGLTYPIALDSNNTTWKRYGNHYWPRQTLVDAKGTIRYEHVGEGDYDEIEARIIELLNEAKMQHGETLRVG
jgi:thiol-disulfide isomerase/thioredoxin